MIGQARLQDVLYHMDVTSNTIIIFFVQTNDSSKRVRNFDLWYYKLGHPFNKVLK